MLRTQRHTAEPMIYARYFVPDEALQVYAAEGEPVGPGYMFFGLMLTSETQFPSSRLACGDAPVC